MQKVCEFIGVVFIAGGAILGIYLATQGNWIIGIICGFTLGAMGVGAIQGASPTEEEKADSRREDLQREILAELRAQGKADTSDIQPPSQPPPTGSRAPEVDRWRE